MASKRHKVAYCKKCGFVDLPNQLKQCSFCNNELSITDDFFDEICSEQDFSTKEEIEEYVRQQYVYFDENYDEELLNNREDGIKINNQVEYYEEKFLNHNSIAKCPICQSKDVETISATTKAASGVVFGLFSSDIRNTMVCKNCGYKF